MLVAISKTNNMNVMAYVLQISFWVVGYIIALLLYIQDPCVCDSSPFPTLAADAIKMTDIFTDDDANDV